MRNIFIGVLSIILLTGCSSAFWGGAAGGVVGTGAGYEYNANKELSRIEEQYKAGTITEAEYNARKDQIKRMSVIK